MYDMNKHDACMFRTSSHPSRIFKILTLGGGLHTRYHIGKTIGLLVYAVSVPVENYILAQQFPTKACKVSSKLNTFHINIHRCIYFSITATRQIYS
jgi:hypothetical protein